jgi:hypothetical protein
VVQIYPNPSGYTTLPAMEYRFYGQNAQGRDTVLVRPDDGQGNFEGELPAGSYRVLAFNAAGAADAEFTGRERYETAAVTVRSASNETGSSQLRAIDDRLLRVVDELEVTGVGTLRREPSPVLLTKQLVLVFTLSGGLEREVTSLTGALPGVYPSVLLSTGLPTPQVLIQSLTAVARFETSVQGSQHLARIGLLGLRDPEYGRTYPGTMALTLNLNDGTREETTVNLSAALSGIIADNGGAFPPLAYIYIELTRSEMGGVGGTVEDWDETGNGLTVIVGSRK